MRGTEIYEGLKAANVDSFPRLFWPNNTLKELQAFRARYAMIRQTPGFGSQFAAIESSIIFRTKADEIQIPSAEFEELKGQISDLLHRLRGAKQYLEAVVKQEDPSSVFVKLEELDSIGDASSLLRRIEQALMQVVLHPKIGGTVKLRAWERGSLWLDIYLGVPAAVGLVGGIAWSAAVVYKKAQEGRLIERLVQGRDLRNEFLAHLSEQNAKLISALVDSEAEHLRADCYGPEVDNEQLERIKNTRKRPGAR